MLPDIFGVYSDYLIKLPAHSPAACEDVVPIVLVELLESIYGRGIKFAWKQGNLLGKPILELGEGLIRVGWLKS